jgi:Protein of unknown function (DUF2933)
MLLATSALAGVLPVLLVLACPLMMIFMMRGMHGGHGHGERGNPARRPLDELKAERDRLNDEIGRRAEETVAP